MRPTTPLLPVLILTLSAHAPFAGAAQPKGDPPAPPAAPQQKQTLEERLMGVWVLAEATTPGTPSGIGIRRKSFSAGRWEIIQKDPRTGEVIFHHGGSYRLNGDILEQKVEFASEKTKGHIGQVRRYKITVEKNTYTQIGLGNPFNEVWKRLDSA